jgi:hypothetical protein
VQVYAELPDPDAPARLIAFTRVEVSAGDATRFECRVPLTRLATRDPSARAWRSATGLHRFVVGRWAGDDAAYSVSLRVSGP